MWARAVEIALASWLALSPFIFGHPDEAAFLWYNDFACALAITIISSVALWPRAEKVHYLNVAVAAYLVVLGFTVPAPPPPAYQNYIVLGIVLFVFAVIPTPTTLPPWSWQDYYIERESVGGKERRG